MPMRELSDPLTHGDSLASSLSGLSLPGGDVGRCDQSTVHWMSNL